MMSVERIALDIKVEAQGIVEALAGKEALPILAEVQTYPNKCIVQHRSRALTCTAYVLPAIRELIKDASCTDPIISN